MTETSQPTPTENGASASDLEAVEQLKAGYEAIRKELKSIIETLPEREQLVLSLYYEEELNLREIGEVLEVSESRVCQIHGQAVVRIRARLDQWLRPE